MPSNSYAERQARAAQRLAELRLDAVLISYLPNIRYLTGFTGSNGALMLLRERSVFFTDPRYRIQAQAEVAGDVRICKGPLLQAVAASVSRNRVRRLGFERDHLSYSGYELLKSKMPLKASLEPVAGLIEPLRMVKSPEEIGLIRAAVRTTSDAFEQALRRARAGMTEQDLAAELDYRMRRLGAERPAFETIVAGGERSALPHARPTAEVIGNGGPVVVDLGAMREGYASDMTRTVFFGKPGSQARRLYSAVLEAQMAAIAAVRPGVTAAYVDRQARDVLRAHGLEREFVHSTGHGLGLEIHEPPRIGKKDKTRLCAGMVITIEPGVYLSGYGGIRIEDTVAVTETGCEVLTPTDKSVRVI